MRIAAVLLGVLVLTGCAGGSGYVVDAEGDGVLVSATSNRDVRMMALIEGELAITADGCLGIAGAEEIYPTVFPVGTVRDGDGIYIVGHGHVELGDRLEGGGGYIPIEDGLPEECQSDEVAIFDVTPL